MLTSYVDPTMHRRMGPLPRTSVAIEVCDAAQAPLSAAIADLDEAVVRFYG
ncbi:MAG: hypothetical protein ACYCZY_03750 [Lacisediminihabitans sp.]